MSFIDFIKYNFEVRYELFKMAWTEHTLASILSVLFLIILSLVIKIYKGKI